MSKTDLPLGKASDYPERYCKDVLFAIPRSESRSKLLPDHRLPFHGVDYWNAWELSWLAENGQPQTATAHMSIAAESESLVESKSLKLYLGSFAMSRFESAEQVALTMQNDLETCVGGTVAVNLMMPNDSAELAPANLDGINLDSLAIGCDVWQVDPDLLQVDQARVVDEILLTHALRSLCPVTGQPDCGSLQIHYVGPSIEHQSLLRYIVSFRQHNDFHEACIERIFVDLKRHCGCEKLSVYARYQRRGGIDINPFRSDFESAPPDARLWRQ